MTDTHRPDRRLFLQMAGLGAVTLAIPAAAQGQGTDMLIVNALGGFGNPNAVRQPGAIQGTRRREIEARMIADAKASGMNAVNVTLGYVSGDMDPFEHSVREIGLWDARLRRHQTDLIQVLTAADILRAREEGRIGVIYGFQNAAMMGTDASRADIFADLGVRVIQLTYNPANQIGDGSMAPGNRGVTPFGREVIAALNRNRVMVDLSHSGERTCLEAAGISRQPISINHTGCRALTDLPRNKTDAELRRVAERGGFVGIYFMPFLSPDSVAEPADVVAHIDHAVNVCGEDHVGIGTDGGTTGVDDMAAYRARTREEIAERRAAGIGAAGETPDTLPFVERLSGPDQFRDLIRLLGQHGYSTGRSEKIMGLNFVRYAREVWGA
ncbi:membrane dipeptidase [Sphingosinicella sp. LHD-64]|uniref:dipeptidase n=1 Tax=Sphingosinicella sp. LHD-64 TaxID=3072139 RepID=UPI00280E3816|nr:membrane dipeptidase [Sphingosinicella sp. LHD-64]MDQ8755941.1 membrane dipeptidase [Sphingosinicella sp. LHD-64]